ncbi:unnamed protein product [Mesocestoides corti]|uniref:Uncharacterized protein n=1 Tax=Mesocestoides corti TaxID=53468 RepID=A0A0R3UCE9_MESCO|nr:unnamed protein product [Mesocestoides corti]
MVNDTEQELPAKQQQERSPHSTRTSGEGDNLDQQLHHQTGPSTNADTEPPPPTSSFFPSEPDLPEPAQQLPTMPEPVPSFDPNPRVCCTFHERLKMVERWINSIPPDTPTDEQTSPTKMKTASDSQSISGDTPTEGDTTVPSTSGGDGGGGGDGGEISKGAYL